MTELDYISQYGCKYVVHGDDITSDSDGNDCYRFVKQAGRFKVVKRSPGISTTDLVGRMLLCTKTHFISSLQNMLVGKEGYGSPEERQAQGQAMMERLRLYATDETAKAPGADVWFWNASNEAKAEHTAETGGKFVELLTAGGPKPGQRIVYVDGGYDLFCSGHIEFLRQVMVAENEVAESSGWFSQEAKTKRVSECGKDYGPAFVVVGVHDDQVINQWKGVNYPIMNIYERGLCVLQCKVLHALAWLLLSCPVHHFTSLRFAHVELLTHCPRQYIHAVIFGAPFTPTKSYLESLPWGVPSAIYHGPTSFMPLTYDPYTAPKAMGIYRAIGKHAFAEANAGEIVQRILRSRDLYEARQRAKGVKAEVEAAAREREVMEEEQRGKEAERSDAAGMS